MGSMQTVTITQCDLRRDIRLMPMGTTYMIDPFGNVVPQEKPTVTQTKSVTTSGGGTVVSTITIKDTGERKQMFGYAARHLIITTETEPSADSCMKTRSKMQTDGWYIDAEWQFSCDRSQEYRSYQNPQQKGGCMDKYSVKQIGTGKRGYPLYEKMTMFDTSGKETYSFTNEVVELSNTTLEAGLFDIPQGFREVKNSSELYASMYPQNSNSNSYNSGSQDDSLGNVSGLGSSIKNMANKPQNTSAELGAKKAGVVRIGLANVKTGSVGDGMNATELAGAIQNTLSQYLKTPQVEIVQLEAKLPSAVDAEAQSKECDYVIYTNVSHKKGGGGMFGKMMGNIAASAVSSVGYGSTAGAIASHTTSTAIYTAANAAGNVKSKDELTLDLKVNQTGGSQALAKQYKAKAKSDGEDIISPIVEQAAQAIIDTVAKK
jgi:hypothetical protein